MTESREVVVLEDHQFGGIAMLPNPQVLREEMSAAVCPTSNKQNPV